MPIPSRRKGEERDAYVSRCISDLTKKGEGKTPGQLAAICHSKADNSLTDEEMGTIGLLLTKAIDLAPPLKKKKKDKYRNTKEDGSGTDDTMAAQVLTTSFVYGHSHRIPQEEMSGDTSHNNGHSHKFKMNSDGSYTIEETGGHTHKLDSHSSGRLKTI
ncbi:hypothetical protein E4G67_01700 [Candidatus Bathyarchaeota archaeon]|nr:MAG: hypothetical protein E4G67_01700 [Candidatus Bathyarchaeota archaeon]